MSRQPFLRYALPWLIVLGACGRGPAPATAPGSSAAARVEPATAAPVPPARVESAAAAASAPAWTPILPSITPDAVARTVAQARQALASGRLERGSSPGPGALELLLAARTVAPGDAAVEDALRDTLDALLERGRLAADLGDFAGAGRVDLIVRQVMPAHRDLPSFEAHVARAREAARLLRAAENAASAGHWVEPANASAGDLLRRAEAALPVYAPVQVAWREWHARLLLRAWKAASAEDFARADAELAQARRFRPGAPESTVMDLRIVELRSALTQALLEQGDAAVDRLDLEGAARALAHAERTAAQPTEVEALRERIHLARHYGLRLPGQVFADTLASGGKGPEMVVIPFGAFRMGAPEDEPAHSAVETPRHDVAFARGFALARNEVTVAQFRRFVAATGYRTDAERGGGSMLFDERAGQMVERAGVDWRVDYRGRPASADSPVIHVSLADADAFARWLSGQTGERYALPSEAQFEYALRAGGESLYPWGGAAPAGVPGNLAGDGDRSPAGRPWGNAIARYRDGYWGPAPVRRFAPEGFGTYDLIGNVAEWTADCWHEGYRRAPSDGSAWVNPGCRQHVVRGASWASSLDQARSAYRSAMAIDSRGARLGFRVAREL